MQIASHLRDAVSCRPWLRFLLAPPVIMARRLNALLRLPMDATRFYTLWKGREPDARARPSGRVVVMIAVSDLRIDPRVERESRALAQAGFEVVVIWPERREAGDAPIDWGPGVTFCGLPMGSASFVSRFPGFLGYEMAQAALEYRPFAFHAHDLSTALIGLVAARRTGAHLVCDFHEWYSENVSWNASTASYRPHSYLTRAAYKWLERLSLRHASEVVTVCRSIADELQQEAGGDARTVQVIRNIPELNQRPTRKYPSLKQELGLSDGDFLLLYQGGVGPSRMIEPIIRALPLVKNCVLVLRGPGTETYGKDYRRLAQQMGVKDRLIVLPSVPSGDVVAAASGADAGIYTVLNICKNFRYALPNKIFEYLAAGLPVLTAHFQEPKAIVERYEVGLSFDPRDPDSIASAIEALASDAERRKRMAERTALALRDLSAGSEWEKLAALYRGLNDRPALALARLEPSCDRQADAA